MKDMYQTGTRQVPYMYQTYDRHVPDRYQTGTIHIPCGSPPGVIVADTLSFNAKMDLVDF